MKGFAVFKSQKLLKVSLEHDGGRIQSVRIHGDFFLYPEDSIAALESALSGVALERTALEAAISSSLEQSGAEAFGFNTPDLASAILQAAELLPPPAPVPGNPPSAGAKTA